MDPKEKLFAGKPSAFGGLSNEAELVQICPEPFKSDYNYNEWSKAAMMIFFAGGKIGHWKWRTADPAVKQRQMACFNGLLGTWGIKHEAKEAVAGWMLSEMLTEVPEHVEVPKEPEEE